MISHPRSEILHSQRREPLKYYPVYFIGRPYADSTIQDLHRNSSQRLWMTKGLLTKEFPLAILMHTEHIMTRTKTVTFGRQYTEGRGGDWLCVQTDFQVFTGPSYVMCVSSYSIPDFNAHITCRHAEISLSKLRSTIVISVLITTYKVRYREPV